MMQERSYCECGNITADGKHPRILFEYYDEKIMVCGNSRECPECLRKSLKNSLDKYSGIGELSDNLPATPKVFWENYVKMKCGGVDELNDLLISLRVFSFSPQGGWQIIIGPAVRNPVYKGRDHLFFRNFVDADEYARAWFGTTELNWQIQLIETSMVRYEQRE